MTVRRRPIAAAVPVAATLLLCGCAALGQGMHREPSRTPAATSTPASAMEIRVGDCLDDAKVGTSATTAPIVPCDDPHDTEAYAEFALADGAYPGDDTVQAQAQKDCGGTAFADFVGIASSDSNLQFSYYFPTEDSWAAGDREVTCTIYQVDGAGKPQKTTGSLRDAAR